MFGLFLSITLYFFLLSKTIFFILLLFNSIFLPKVNTLRTMQQMPKTKTIPNFFEPPPALKICDVLSDVLREPITGKIYRTVKCQVKNHSALTKQGKCWSVTALIADHTSSVEVCFDSEVRDKEKFVKTILPQSSILWCRKREKS